MPLPLRVTTAAPIAAGAVVWRYRGDLRVTVAIKAVFSLVPNGAAVLRAPVDLTPHDVSFGRDPSRSLEYASDLVPFRPRADITFLGDACAPPGPVVSAMAVRLAVYRGAPVVERTLHVIGDRRAGNPTPAEIQRIPLRYERAMASEQNPVGLPAGELPNLLDPADPTCPAAFGPLAAHWAARRAHLGALARCALDAPILDIPDDVDWRFFQAAPAAQQAPYLQGDEWIVLDGLHSAHPRQKTQLPGARAAARTYLEGHTNDVELVIDTLAIDGRSQTCALVWRGGLRVPGEAALEALQIAAWLELAGHSQREAPRGPHRSALAATAGLSMSEQIAAAARAVTPFAPAQAAAPAAPRVPPPSPLVMTAGLSMGEQIAAAARAITPFEPVRASAPEVPAPPPVPVEVAPPPPPPPAPPPGPGPEVPPRKTPAIPVFNRTPFILATMPWQVSPPRDSLTILVKGSFDLAPSAPAKPRPEADLLCGDVHRDNDPEKSLEVASDFAIFKPRADVLLRAVAYRGASGLARVTFRFGHPGNRFERTFAVFGDRRWRSTLGGWSMTSPEPFNAIPIVHERAFGGPRFDDNPVGVGHAAVDQGPLPNIEDPTRLLTPLRPAPAPACFGPIPPLWKERRVKLGTYDSAWLKTRWPYFPEDFDWSYFQAAPRAQQLAYLAGDEPYEITGMHRELPSLSGRLPGLRLRCVLQQTGGALREATMRLDTASFDAEAMQLHLLWRGVLEVSGDEAPELEAIFLTTEAMISTPAQLAEVRAACLATDLPLVEEAPAPPANDAPEAPEATKLKADLDARLKEAHAKLDAAGIELEPPKEGPLPPPPDPEALGASLRSAGVPEKEVAGVVSAVKAANKAREDAETEAPRVDLRGKVLAALLANQPLDGTDLTGADLSQIDFGGCSLAGVRLLRAKLNECNLAEVDLTAAQLGEADLTEAFLDNAKLERADFHGARLDGVTLDRASVDGADFSNAHGRGASFRGARGTSAQFAGGCWERACFDEAQLPAADFTGAKLEGASFANAVMPEVRLFDAQGSGVRFDGAGMAEARGDEASLAGSSFNGVEAPRSTWEKAVLDRSSFRGAGLRQASFVRASAGGAVFAGADLGAARLSRAALVEARFTEADLMQASLERADLRRVDFTGANLHQAETWKANLEGALLDRALVSGSKLRGKR